MKRYLFSAVAPKITTNAKQPQELSDILGPALNNLSPNTFSWDVVAKKIQYALADELLLCKPAVSVNEAKKKMGATFSPSNDLQIFLSTRGTAGDVLTYTHQTNEKISETSKIFVDTATFFQHCIDIILYNPRLQEITQKLANLSLTPESHSDTETNTSGGANTTKILYTPANAPASRLNDMTETSGQSTATRTLTKWDGQLTKDALIAAKDNINDAIMDIIAEIKTLLVPAKLIQDSLDWGLCSDLDDVWIEGYDSEEDM